MNHVPLSTLERALRYLEKTHEDAAPKIQGLREAIARGRAEGWLTEPIERGTEHELNNILSRTEFNSEDLVRLTAKLLKEAPP